MDIEKLIEKLHDASQSQIGMWAEDNSAVIEKSAAALSTLQAENEKLRGDVVRFNDMLASYQNVLVPELRAELERVKVERDAAISDLETIMAYGGGNLDTCQYCKNGQCYARGGTKPCLPKWRGKKEEEA